MRCEISPLAAADLYEIGDYIARDNLQRAVTFVEELLAHSRKIAQMPSAYPTRDELVPGLHACSHQRYIIFFTVTDSSVRIERNSTNAKPSLLRQSRVYSGLGAGNLIALG